MPGFVQFSSLPFVLYSTHLDFSPESRTVEVCRVTNCHKTPINENFRLSVKPSLVNKENDQSGLSQMT